MVVIQSVVSGDEITQKLDATIWFSVLKDIKKAHSLEWAYKCYEISICFGGLSFASSRLGIVIVSTPLL